MLLLWNHTSNPTMASQTSPRSFQKNPKCNLLIELIQALPELRASERERERVSENWLTKASKLIHSSIHVQGVLHFTVVLHANRESTRKKKEKIIKERPQLIRQYYLCYARKATDIKDLLYSFYILPFLFFARAQSNFDPTIIIDCLVKLISWPKKCCLNAIELK